MLRKSSNRNTELFLGASANQVDEQHEQEMLFHRPLFKDWIFWLACVACVAALQGTLTRSYPDGIEGQEMAFLIDVNIVLAFQLLLFGFIPALLRRHVRRRQRRSAASTSTSAEQDNEQGYPLVTKKVIGDDLPREDSPATITTRYGELSLYRDREKGVWVVRTKAGKQASTYYLEEALQQVCPELIRAERLRIIESVS